MHWAMRIVAKQFTLSIRVISRPILLCTQLRFGGIVLLDSLITCSHAVHRKADDDHWKRPIWLWTKASQLTKQISTSDLGASNYPKYRRICSLYSRQTQEDTANCSSLNGHSIRVGASTFYVSLKCCHLLEIFTGCPSWSASLTGRTLFITNVLSSCTFNYLI